MIITGNFDIDGRKLEADEPVIYALELQFVSSLKQPVSCEIVYERRNDSRYSNYYGKAIVNDVEFNSFSSKSLEDCCINLINEIINSFTQYLQFYNQCVDLKQPIPDAIQAIIDDAKSVFKLREITLVNMDNRGWCVHYEIQRPYDSKNNQWIPL